MSSPAPLFSSTRKSRQSRISELLPASKPTAEPPKRKRGRPRKHPLPDPPTPAPHVPERHHDELSHTSSQAHAQPLPSTPVASSPQARASVQAVDTPSRGRRLDLPGLDSSRRPRSARRPRPLASPRTALPVSSSGLLSSGPLSVAFSVAPDGVAALDSPTQSAFSAAAGLCASAPPSSVPVQQSGVPASRSSSKATSADLIPAQVAGMGRVLLDRRVLNERLGSQGASAAIGRAATSSGTSSSSSLAPPEPASNPSGGTVEEPLSSQLAAWLADTSGDDSDSEPLAYDESATADLSRSTVSSKTIASLDRSRMNEDTGVPSLTQSAPASAVDGSFKATLSLSEVAKVADDQAHSPGSVMACVCDGDGDGTMVQCDDCDTWFHATCVGLRASQLDKQWSCFRCTGGPLPGLAYEKLRSTPTKQAESIPYALFGPSGREPVFFDPGQQTPRQGAGRFPDHLALAPSPISHSTPKHRSTSNLYHLDSTSENIFSSYHSRNSSTAFASLRADYSPKSPIVTRRNRFNGQNDNYTFGSGSPAKDALNTSLQTYSSPRPRLANRRSNTAPSLLLDPYEDVVTDGDDCPSDGSKHFASRGKQPKTSPQRRSLAAGASIPSSPPSPSTGKSSKCTDRRHHRKTSSLLSGVLPLQYDEEDSGPLFAFSSSSAHNIPSTPSRGLSSAALGVNTPSSQEPDSAVRIHARRLSFGAGMSGVQATRSYGLVSSIEPASPTPRSRDIENDESSFVHTLGAPLQNGKVLGLGEAVDLQTSNNQGPGLGIDMRGVSRPVKALGEDAAV